MQNIQPEEELKRFMNSECFSIFVLYRAADEMKRNSCICIVSSSNVTLVPNSRCAVSLQSQRRRAVNTKHSTCYQGVEIWRTVLGDQPASSAGLEGHQGLEMYPITK